MSYCVRMKMPDGSVAFVRMRGKRPPACIKCGATSTRECDWKIKDSDSPHPPIVGRAKARRPLKTCDAALCDECTYHPAPDKDLCPAHAEIWRAHLGRKEKNETQTQEAPRT